MKRTSLFHWCWMMFAGLALTMTLSCEKDPQQDPEDGKPDDPKDEPEEVVRPELKNQLAFGKDTLDIRTALWTKNKKGHYEVYMTPRAGIEYMDELLAEDDYAKLEVKQAEGALDVAEDFVALNYRDFNLKSKDVSGMDSVSIRIALKENTLSTDIYAGKGNRIFEVKYDGSVSLFTPAVLDGEWECDQEKTSIGSVVEYVSEGKRYLYLYHGENVTDVPEENGLSDYISIVTPEGLFGEFNLDEERDRIEITYHDLSMQQAQKVSGVLSLMKDKSGKKLTVLLESEMDGHSLRASWTGERIILFNMENKLSFTDAEGWSGSIRLGKVFMEKDRLQTTRIAIGLQENPSSWEDLMNGRYAMQFNVLDMDETIDLSGSQRYGLQIFDYENYRTYNASELDAQGSIRVFDDPNGTENVIGFVVDATLSNGMKIQAEWFGECTLADSFELTPVAPQQSYITITDKNGKVTEQLPVLKLKVMDKPGFQSQFTGAVFDAKEFYFVNANSADGSMSALNTPILALNVSCIGQENVDLTQEPNLFDFRYTPFNSSGIASPSDWSGTTTYGNVTAMVDEDGIWKIRFEVKDYGDWWGLGNPTGSESTIVIEWEGPAEE